MKLATWNVNSLNVRLGHVLDWLAANPVDALCLQELKLPDERFPQAALREAGYHAIWAGQKTYNGVAIVSRAPLQDVQRNIPGFEDAQQRVIAGTLAGVAGQAPVRIVSAYCPNGQSVGSDKYAYKLAWFEALRAWLQDELKRDAQLAVLGDYNVAPADEDVHDPEGLAGGILVSDAERAAFQALLALGLHDTFRAFEQPEAAYTWWDYRRMSFRRNAGLRIDHILTTPALLARCTGCTVDKAPRGWPKPSDHAPVVAQFDAA